MVESELLALRACPDASVPSDAKSVANCETVVCNCPSALSFDRIVESEFCSAVIGIVAIATARFNTLCRSLEYWLTPVKVTGAKGDVLVLMGLLDLLIGAIGASCEEGLSGSVILSISWPKRRPADGFRYFAHRLLA